MPSVRNGASPAKPSSSSLSTCRLASIPIPARCWAQLCGPTCAGLVTLAAPRSLQQMLAARMVENTLFTLPEPDAPDYANAMVEALRGRLDSYRAVLLGPGLGHEPQKIAFVRLLLESGILAGKRLLVD